MNYLGHAFIASLVRPDPAFVLGAMLPDFFHMAALVPSALDRAQMDERLRDGVAFHHRTDDAFHSAPAFILAQRRVQVALFQAGVSKGPARAMAHIGVEFLIDSSFIPHEEGYLEALALGATDMGIWQSWGGSGARLRALCEHLHMRGWTAHETTELRLAERLRAALRARPRLSPSPREAELAAGCLAADAAHVRLLSGDIVKELLEAFGAMKGASPRSFS